MKSGVEIGKFPMKSNLKITLVNPKPELVGPSCGPLSLLDIYVVQLKMSPLVLT